MLPQTVPIHRLTSDDVMAMAKAGILAADARLELVDGVLVEMSPIGPRHGDVLEWLAMHFVKAAGDEFRVRVQDTFLTPGGFVQPDLMVFRPIPRGRQPATALLVVEISDSSLARDQEKAATYAAAGVPDYWIVDVERDELLVHRDLRAGGYTSVEHFRPGDIVMPSVAAPPVDVAAMLARD